MRPTTKRSREFLNVFEEVNREIPFDGLHWFFDHCRNDDRSQHRTREGAGRRHRGATPHGLPGRVFRRAIRGRSGQAHSARSGACSRWACRSAPARTRRGSRATTHGCRSTGWSLARPSAVSGCIRKRIGSIAEEALKLYTLGSSWFSTENGKKGALAPGQLADLTVLSADYFSIPEEEIKQLESVLTIVGGKIVYATAEFSRLAPPDLPVSPTWSPVNTYGGYAKRLNPAVGASHSSACSHVEKSTDGGRHSHLQVRGDFGLWGLGCDCFAF